MTEGNILRKIGIFAIPCILTRVFQNLYNLIDSAMVGQVFGVASLAAVGVAGSIIALFNDTFFGFVSGFSIVAAKKYGAGDMDGVKKIFVNALAITALLGVAVSVMGALFAREMLVLMQTPEENMADAMKYTVVVFLGMWSMVFYNFFAEMLRAVGNSKMPLIFLIFSFVFHALLNVVLLFWFDTGVAGAALSTVISQIASVVLCVVYTYSKMPCFKIKLEDIRIDLESVGECMKMGVPMAVTNFVVMFGVIILSFVTNKMGTEYIAGYSCASKIGYIITAPLFGFASAVSVFVSQNMGAGKFDRVKEGVRKTLIFVTLVNAVLFLLTKLIERPLLSYLLSGDEVGTEAGLMYLDIRICAMFVLTFAAVFKNVTSSLGKPFFPMISGFLEIAVRYIIPLSLTSVLGFAAVPITDAITWTMLAIFLTPAYIYEFNKIKKETCGYGK